MRPVRREPTSVNLPAVIARSWRDRLAREEEEEEEEEEEGLFVFIGYCRGTQGARHPAFFFFKPDESEGCAKKKSRSF